MLGFFYLVLVLALFCGAVLIVGRLALKLRYKIERKLRDDEIEANMRLGYRDAQTQQHIAEQIIREHREGRS